MTQMQKTQEQFTAGLCRDGEGEVSAGDASRAAGVVVVAKPDSRNVTPAKAGVQRHGYLDTVRVARQVHLGWISRADTGRNTRLPRVLRDA